MRNDTALIFHWLNILTKKRYDAVTQKFGSLDEALSHIDLSLLRALGCREETAMGTLNRLDAFDPGAYAAELLKHAITLINWEDPTYPSALREIADPPVFLSYKGSIEILNQPCIACVGTREMSTYGRRVVEHFVPPFVRAGLTTVSGLARGIDAEVAKQTLEASGKTVAVLGHGLGKIYPSANAKLSERIIQEGGLLLSEFPLDQAPESFMFPARNRIIAGLSLGTLVLEAGEGSGALITADLALEYGRDVFAVPGQIFDPQYAGCHRLLSEGRGRLTTTPEEVLIEIGIVSPVEATDVPFVSEDLGEQRILRALTTMPQSVSDLVEKASLDAAIINAKLTILELHGVAKNAGGGLWVRSTLGRGARKQ